MSFDVYLQSFSHGDPVGIPCDAIRETFGDALSETEADWWRLSFSPDVSCDLSLSALDDDPQSIHSIIVERPCHDHRLWDGLAHLLGKGSSVIYFPGCSGPLVADIAVVAHIPRDMLDTLGQPLLVKSGQDILQHVVTA
ncbi:hypothetical protein [Billgrantia desiderata]|uniref:hypothetical protein n=1 Tax=Billgrantia desiderata TaxID=52021 RepID=UPI001F2A58A6|nr:hypothetical protein [Halomonas desiderata]